jgi:hypothetical protein
MTSPAERKIGEPQNLPAYVMTSWATLFSLHALATLKVADHMSDDPVSIEALASATGTHAEPLRRVMNLLVAEGLVGSTADGRIMHNEYSRMLRSEHPSSIRAMLSMRNWPLAAEAVTAPRSAASRLPPRCLHGTVSLTYRNVAEMRREGESSTDPLAGRISRDWTSTLQLGSRRCGLLSAQADPP